MSSDALPDINVLVALTNASHVHHREAHQWLEQVSRFWLTPVTEVGLIRTLLNPAITGQRLAARQALEVLDGVRRDPRAGFLPDDSSLADAGVDLTGLGGHQQVPDWHLLNLAARHEATLVTFDRKLSRSVVPADRARLVVLG